MDSDTVTKLRDIPNDNINEELISVLLTNVITEADVTSEHTPTSDTPVVSSELLHKRIHTYVNAGVPLFKAIELTLTDAIETVDTATEHEFTGPVGALIET